MANYNVEMNSLNSSGNYDVLYPRTLLSNVQDWSTNLYSKSEVDSQIVSNINTLVPALGLTKLKQIVATESLTGNRGTVIMPENNTNYTMLILSFINFQINSSSSSTMQVSFGDSIDSGNLIGSFSLTANRGSSYMVFIYILSKETGFVIQYNPVALSSSMVEIAREIELLETKNIRWYSGSDSYTVTRGRINIYGL